ncbi:5-formyltetrahydrofolate cyclo-ligase [Nitratifractor sp.]
MHKNGKKIIFREKALRRLKAQCGPRAYAEDKRIVNRLKEWILRQNPKSVMIYLPLPIEVDVRPLIRWLRRRRVSVYVPFMEGESFRLVKYRLPLRKKRFGIYEPKLSNERIEKKIDLAIVPIVGTDPTGKRVGFGKGMYDRFIAREKKNIKEIIFIQRALCWSPEVVTDSHDMEARVLMTGRQSYRLGSVK